jgi:hypothetical protein
MGHLFIHLQHTTTSTEMFLTFLRRMKVGLNCCSIANLIAKLIPKEIKKINLLVDPEEVATISIWIVFQNLVSF